VLQAPTGDIPTSFITSSTLLRFFKFEALCPTICLSADRNHLHYNNVIESSPTFVNRLRRRRATFLPLSRRGRPLIHSGRCRRVIDSLRGGTGQQPSRNNYRHRRKMLWISRDEPVKALGERLNKHVSNRAFYGTAIMLLSNVSSP
jgi:hypothetical protein